MASAANVKVKGVLYPIEQLLDKSIYANKTTLLYPYIGGKPLLQIAAGNLIGKMYSWNTAANGDIYLNFYSSSSGIKNVYPGGYYLVKLSDINASDLNNQGAKTTQQKEEEDRKKAEDQNKSFSDKALEAGQKTLLTGAVIFAIAMIIKSKI